MLNFNPYFSMSCNLPYQTRSICGENFTGEKGKAGMATDGTMAVAARNLGPGWKYSPSIKIKPGETAELCNISDRGSLRHIWMSGYDIGWRLGILRFYWDDSPVPSVECPIGDFFGAAEPETQSCYSSLMTAINPKIGCNCYWEMPFRKRCRITYENLYHKETHLFYQIDYLVGEVPENAGYFHAQFRRENPVKRKVPYTIVDGIEGRGQYVGIYMYWRPHCNDWWGEGEIKFYIDGDKEYPTICGTGTEDYFCGNDGYAGDYAGLYTGFLMRKEDGYGCSQQPAFSMYRWHVTDPIYFEKDLRVTIQDLGWARRDRSTEEYAEYAVLTDDISSVAFWYQMEPAKKMYPLPPVEELVML